MGRVGLIKESAVKAGQNRYPSRFVLRRVKEKTFTTHLEVFPPAGEP